LRLLGTSFSGGIPSTEERSEGRAAALCSE